MNTKKKILMALALVGCAILLVVGSVAVTMAYLTSQTETITNTFTVGNVAITMDETDVNEYGEKDGDARVTNNSTYKLIPNKNYTKDPIIKVGSDSENCYVFFKLENGLEGDATFNINTTNWTQIGETGVYYYNAVAQANDKLTAFTEFKVSGTADVAKYASAKIVVTGYAVQAQGFANATEAWNATFGAPANP